MQLTKLLVSYLVLVTKICLAGIMLETPKPDKSGLVEATINILRTCYKDRIGTVGLAGVSGGDTCKTWPIKDIDIPVTLIDETSRVVNNGPISPESRHKLQVFVVTVTDTSALAKNLKQIKNSKWWNHMASIFLLDWPESNHGCFNVYEMLWETWKMNLLNSKLICLHRTRGKLIYTYNPYTNKAPVPWRLENTYNGKNEHIWTLFAQVYREGEAICEALDFDKTRDLAGYEIRVSVAGMENWWYADPKMKPRIYDRGQNISGQTLIDAINATWKFFSYPVRDSRTVDDNGQPYGTIREVFNGINDIALNVRNQYGLMNYTVTYPFARSGLSVVTQYRGHMSQMEKLASVLDRSSHSGVLLVSLSMLLFFKYYMRNPLMQAILKFLLIMCSAALPKIPNRLAPRIYLGSLFIFMLTIQGIYQGQLASLLTKQVPLPNVNTFEDLARSSHTIYGNAIFTSSFNISAFEGRYVGLDVYNCTGYVLRDPNAACVNDQVYLLTEAANSKLHLSRDMFVTFYVVYIIRSDWPLEDRVNTIFSRCVESYLLESPFERNIHSIMSVLDSYEKQDEDSAFEVLTVEELNFAFALLGIGLGCAILSFVTEIIIHRSRVGSSRSRLRQ